MRTGRTSSKEVATAAPPLASTEPPRLADDGSPVSVPASSSRWSTPDHISSSSGLSSLVLYVYIIRSMILFSPCQWEGWAARVGLI